MDAWIRLCVDVAELTDFQLSIVKVILKCSEVLIENRIFLHVYRHTALREVY